LQLQDQKLFASNAISTAVDRALNAAHPGTNRRPAEVLGAIRDMARRRRQAIAAADKAAARLARQTAKERAQILRKWFDLMMAIRRSGPTDDREQASARESKGEYRLCRSFIEWFGEEASGIYGDTSRARHGQSASSSPRSRSASARRSRREFRGMDHPKCGTRSLPAARWC